MAALSDTKRIAFFINIYQCMYVHHFFKMVNEGDKSKEVGYLNQLKQLITRGQQDFCYNIAGNFYTLDQIKHGILRGNKKKPGNCLSTLSYSDPKTLLLSNTIHKDPRINFICLDFPDFVEHIEVIHGEDQDQLNQSLNEFVGEILNAKVVVNLMNDEFVVPALVKTYRDDFGGSDQSIIEFIYGYLENPDISLD